MTKSKHTPKDLILKLKGEGETKTLVRVRKECDFCGEPAHFKFTFLLPNARRNTSSSGYMKDDCSWCSDAEQYTCKDCEQDGYKKEGFGWCSKFEVSDRFAHMFLAWEEKITTEELNRDEVLKCQ